MEQYFFSYLPTCEVYLIEVLENMAQMLQNIFFKLKSNKGEFRLYFELFEKSCRGRHHSEISKTILDRFCPLNQYFKMKNQRNWLKQC